MNSDFVVRRMTSRDRSAVVAIAASLKDVPQWPQMFYLTAINHGSNPERIALIAEERDTGKIAAFAVASLLAPESELETIAVASEYQRRGIGGRLIAEILDKLKAANVLQFHLEVRESNHNALAFYRSRGWRETGRRPRYYAEPEEDAVLMTLDLA